MPRNCRFQALQISMVTLAIALGSAMACMSQVPTPSPAPTETPAREPLSEADPTKPILWVVRNEYRDLKEGAWSNTIVFRHDRFAFRSLSFKGGAKGLVARFEVPISAVHVGNNTKAGLGDIYAQALFVPRISRKFAFSLGSGLILPTATDTMLGSGKLTVAPVAVPVWFSSNRKRLTTLRIQHYISIAGKGGRPGVNHTVANPLIAWALSRQAWIFTDTEFKWDWRQKMGSAISGVQIGHSIGADTGLTIKMEIPWGPGRLGGFNVKVSFFTFR